MPSIHNPLSWRSVPPGVTGQPLASDEKRLQAEGFVQLVHRLVRGARRNARPLREPWATWMSPTVFKKKPARPRTQLTARSMAAWSVSGSYQVLAVCCRSPQGARVMALIVGWPRRAARRPRQGPRNPPCRRCFATSGSCRAAAPSRTDIRPVNADVELRRSPVARHTDEADKALILRAHNGLQHTAASEAVCQSDSSTRLCS